MIYKDVELKCTEEKLDEFISGLDINYSLHDFDELYNGVKVANPTNDANAKYYVLKLNDMVYLQAHSPFDSGFVAITDENFEEVMNGHKESIVDDLIFGKFAVNKEEDAMQEQLDAVAFEILQLKGLA
ncbi:hypothetical protein [Caldalkalibacillus mannanilyticus]|uniref:hypothetical protein n=1 Tax=Caldalkalibacillus mannanilyticus TaxID=1418 RepID=UPI000468D2FB|nr:hypothetical protein [Caldalkalibacillus mannanilyticus]